MVTQLGGMYLTPDIQGWTGGRTVMGRNSRGRGMWGILFCAMGKVRKKEYLSGNWSVWNITLLLTLASGPVFHGHSLRSLVYNQLFHGHSSPIISF